MCRDCGCSVTGTVPGREAHPHERGSHEDHAHASGHGGGHQSLNLHEHHHHHDGDGHTNPALADAKTVIVLKGILEENDRQAAHIREHLDKKSILAINVMGSPGCGKTSLLESTASRFPGVLFAIEGDLETDRDAERLKRAGIPSHQITTGQACHLDAFMVHSALHHIDVKDNSILFVENVGNLVCPAVYDIGAHLNAVLLSVTEGDDKIAKYPVMFGRADLLIITKSDLIPHVSFDIEAARRDFRRINRGADMLILSSRDTESMGGWFSYLEFKRRMRG